MDERHSQTRSQASFRSFEELEVGMRASFSHRVTARDLDNFASLSGDFNPLHMDEEFAAKSRFGRRVVHGMFLASLFSRLVGMHLPGRQCLYLSQNLDFSAPAFLDDVLEVSGEVVQKQESMRTLGIATRITNQSARTLVRGKALVEVLP